MCVGGFSFLFPCLSLAHHGAQQQSSRDVTAKQNREFSTNVFIMIIIVKIQNTQNNMFLVKKTKKQTNPTQIQNNVGVDFSTMKIESSTKRRLVCYSYAIRTWLSHDSGIITILVRCLYRGSSRQEASSSRKYCTSSLKNGGVNLLLNLSSPPFVL